MAKEEALMFVGTIYGVRYYAPESSWGVVQVSSKTEIPFSTPITDYDLETNQSEQIYITTITGKMPEPHVGDIYSIEGRHKYVEKFKSDQYEIVSINPVQPKTPEEQRAYLSAILTEKQAETLLAVYPTIVQDVVDGKDNVDFSLLNGIKEKTWTKIREKIIESFAISDILSLLIPLGISFKKTQLLLDGEPNPHILRQKIISNPYLITAIDGISFATADKIAIKLNESLKESESRLVAFIKHRLNDMGNESGDTFTSLSELRGSVIETVPEVEKYFDAYIEKQKEKSTVLHIEGENVGLKSYYQSEKFIFDTIVAIDRSSRLYVAEETIEQGITEAEAEQGFTLTEEQRKIVYDITTNNFNILTGRAGTGKSTLSRAILKVYALAGYSIGVAAFSAKAATRAQEATGFEAMTIHRLLGANGQGFTYGLTTKLPHRVILLDESSMTNAMLFKAFFSAVDTTITKVILVGDRGQLPPINAGNIFFDLFDVDYPFNRFELTKIQRQAQDSAIIVDANKIREGISPVTKEERATGKTVHGVRKDLFYGFRSGEGAREALFERAVSSFVASVEKKGLENVVLITPRKADCINSTRKFNQRIQQEVNGMNASNKFTYGKSEFWLCDKVIHTVNDYEKEVFNGEVGFVTNIFKKGIEVTYPSKVVKYENDEVYDLELAYALTVHKMQGSQSSDVIVVIDNSHYALLSNQLLYTAVTRAQERCMILAETYAFKMSLVENKNIRDTWLKGFVAND